MLETIYNDIKNYKKKNFFLKIIKQKKLQTEVRGESGKTKKKG